MTENGPAQNVTPTYKHEGSYIPRRLALRWRIDYVGRRPIFGAWSSTKIMAKPHSGKPNIKEVMIEASDLVTGEIRTLARCPGHEWLEFRWVLAGPLMIDTKMEGAIHGLTIVTQQELATVFVDGKTAKKINLAWRKPS